MKNVLHGVAIISFAASTAATSAPILAPPPTLSEAVQAYVKVSAGRNALTHVRLIDGTGAPPLEDRTILLDGPTITAIQLASDPVPQGFHVLDLSGASVVPGIVGMHNHMFHIARPNLDASGHSDQPLLLPQMTFSAPRLYLANGVTTVRTAGSVEPYADLNVKAQIDAGRLVGPHMDVTGPYLEGANSSFIQMHQITAPQDARRMVAYWAEQGVTSFKAYTNITRAELKAAIDEVHSRGMKITGHLCSVTYPEAALLGIDNLEHGFRVNTQLDPDKQPDKCPETAGIPTLVAMKPGSAEANALIKLLLDKHVAITSTLPVFEHGVALHAPLRPEAMAVLTPQAREALLFSRNRTVERTSTPQAAALRQAYQNNLGLELQFARAGGLLIAGPDPTGSGGVIPGFGDQRQLELMVEAGFSPLEAIRISTLNGARFLGLQGRIGSIAVGKNADLVVIRGNPAANINDVEKVEMVFKDGVGFDSKKLIQSVLGRYGQY